MIECKFPPITTEQSTPAITAQSTPEEKAEEQRRQEWYEKQRREVKTLAELAEEYRDRLAKIKKGG